MLGISLLAANMGYCQMGGEDGGDDGYGDDGNSQWDVVENDDGSYTITFPDGTYANTDVNGSYDASTGTGSYSCPECLTPVVVTDVNDPSTGEHNITYTYDGMDFDEPPASDLELIEQLNEFFFGSPNNSNDNSNNPPPNDPCAKAKEMAKKFNEALKDPDIKAHLNQFIADYKNSSAEHGFAIIKNADGSYSFSQTFIGTSNNIHWTFTGDPDIVALIHIHPDGSSAAASPTDVFGLNDHHNADFTGSIIVSGDDMYMISVTNEEKYNKFVSHEDDYYDSTTESQWKNKSKMFDAYYNFLHDAKDVYQGSDINFPAMLYLMDKYMGVSMQKWSNDSGNDDDGFSPIATKMQYNSNTGSSSTLNGVGQSVNSPYSNITIEVSCH